MIQLTKEEIQQCSNKLLAKHLAKHNQWRRTRIFGDMPYTAETVGLLIDEAVRRLANPRVHIDDNFNFN